MTLLYAYWFNTSDGKESHIQFRADSDEEADKRFKEMKLAGMYAKPQQVMLNERLYRLAIPKGM